MMSTFLCVHVPAILILLEFNYRGVPLFSEKNTRRKGDGEENKKEHQEGDREQNKKKTRVRLSEKRLFLNTKTTQIQARKQAHHTYYKENHANIWLILVEPSLDTAIFALKRIDHFC